MDAVPAALSSCDQPLATCYDVALLDLDGVVYVGPEAVTGVPAALTAVRQAGMRLAYVTNNASRTPESIAEHLSSLGVAADPSEVITSAQAAAHYLADRLPAGAPVLVVGTTGLLAALRERGLTPVDSAERQPQAVVQGYSPELDWRQLAEGAVAIRAGATWIATNLDPTVPSPRGPLPGNGSMVAALRTATGVTPISTGKPDPTMHRESVERSGAQRPIVVGDRLDTDIEGANAADCPSLLVLSGVTGPIDLIEAPAALRPSYLAADLTGLLSPHPQPHNIQQWWHCGRWRARFREGRLQLAQSPGAASAESSDGLDAVRALCEAAWHGGATDDAAATGGASRRITGCDEQAAGELRRLGMLGGSTGGSED